MNSVEAASGRWAEIFRHFGLPEITGNRHVDCPICKRKKKFRAHCHETGAWICTCGNGKGFKLLEIVTGRDFKSLAEEVDRITGRQKERQLHAVPKVDPAKRVVEKFKSLSPLRGTQAQDYLKARGIYCLPAGGVKFSRAEIVDGMIVPAMYAIASDHYSRPMKTHLTYLEGDKKHPTAVQGGARKLFTVVEDDYQPLSVKLFQATDVLGVGEGIETCLSAYQLYSIPVWSTLNSALLERFVAPKHVKKLYIYADNDDNLTGLAAAMQCGKKNLLSNNDVEEVIIRWPEQSGDFNDVVLTGAKVLQWVGTRDKTQS